MNRHRAKRRPAALTGDQRDSKTSTASAARAPGRLHRRCAQNGATDRLNAVLASQSAPALTEALADPSPEVARAAIHRLAQVEGPRAASALRARLLDADPSLVADIAKALRAIGDATLLDLALLGLHEQPYTRRLAAARALGALADPHAADALCDALDDEVAAVRIAALDALAALGPAAAVGPACARLLADSSAHVRIAAVRAVARTAPHPGTLLAPAAADGDRLVRLAVARHISGLPEQAATSLLGDRDVQVRVAAADAAGMRHLGGLVLLLTEDPSRDVRLAAAHTLGRLGDARVADVLIAGVEDRDAIVRAAVVRGLEQLVRRGGAVRRLCHELDSGRPGRRRASLYALARLEALEASGCVARLAGDPDPDVRLAVIHTARSLLSNPEPLVRHLSTDRDVTVRHAAELWLLANAERSVPI
jgi:HEAT repeat protein